MSKMSVRVLFIQRKEGYEGEYAPEAILCQDEFSEEENPDWFDYEMTKQLSDLKDDVIGHCVVRFEVDQDRIRELCFKREETIEAKEI
jgi:hypothetical protein